MLLSFIYLDSGVLAQEAGGHFASPLNFGLLEKCQKVFLSANFHGKMQTFVVKTSILRKSRGKIYILSAHNLLSEICGCLSLFRGKLVMSFLKSQLFAPLIFTPRALRF